jgi:hypothetical protein
MTPTPKWYMPVAVLALLWNLIGCAAYLSDVMMTTEAVAQLPADQQALYAARPAWAVAAYAIAVWGGALGSLGLVLKKRWASPLLMASVAGLVVQDLALFVFSPAAGAVSPVAYVLQGMVFVIALALVRLAGTGSARGWLS